MSGSVAEGLFVEAPQRQSTVLAGVRTTSPLVPRSSIVPVTISGPFGLASIVTSSPSSPPRSPGRFRSSLCAPVWSRNSASPCRQQPETASRTSDYAQRHVGLRAGCVEDKRGAPAGCDQPARRSHQGGLFNGRSDNRGKAKRPVCVTGTIELRDTNGNVLLTPARTVLCRCGASTKKPFCDGTTQRSASKPRHKRCRTRLKAPQIPGAARVSAGKIAVPAAALDATEFDGVISGVDPADVEKAESTGSKD